MYFDRRVILSKVEISRDDDGYQTEMPTSKEMWAHRQSVTGKEHFAAMQAGVSVSSVYCVRAEMYNPDYEYLTDGEPKFKITRTYDRNDGIVEITCGRVHDGTV